jgi:tetratricopeptide (TPR) repeat protein
MNLNSYNDVNFSPKLVLNMIVKNESHIIERLLRSVIPIIDAYCICDTGSNDNTKTIIQNVMSQAGISGEVYEEPFKNFGYNRTHALKRAASWGTYALLLDADMKLVISDSFQKTDLVLDGYSIEQRAGNLRYQNTRFVRLNKGIECIGPTHEYYNFPSNCKTGTLHNVWIEDYGDGGCKSNKFQRDIDLLTEALKKEPNNERYHFYLAQSYKDIGNINEAIIHYSRRIKLGGWKEEVFYSYLQLGHLYKVKGENEKAISVWFDAYNCHPHRSESLYEICKLWRCEGKHNAAFLIYNIGKDISYPSNDTLFIDNSIYNGLWDYEYSILAYWLKKDVNQRVYLNTMYKCIHTVNMLSNLKFYAIHLTKNPDCKIYVFNEKVCKNIGGNIVNFYRSSPSLLKNDDDTYTMNVRYVSYTIDNKGIYNLNNNIDKITSIQKRCILSRNLDMLSATWIDGIHNLDLQYQGVEDVRIYKSGITIKFIGTVQHPDTKKITVGYGDYNGNKLIPTICNSPMNKDCEKNWVSSGLDNNTFVYSWKPLRIGFFEQDHFIFKNINENMPELFRDIRGSSNGVLFNDELWFLVHMVSYESPRYYYHMIVILDSLTFEYKRHSILFKFTENSIEYGLGLLVEKERLCISYSVHDSSSYILSIPIEKTAFLFV